MMHAVFVRPGLVEWRETIAPCIKGPGEAIVRPVVVGRCDLDVAFVRGLVPLAAGEPIGHEIIGEIVDLSEDVARFRVGDRVFVSAQISCGACSRCRAGSTGRCSAVPFAASYGMGRDGGYGGGLADLVRVPFAAAMLTPVPAAADAARLIGLADMASDAWRGIGEQASRMPDARVLVIGGMPAVIGLYAVGIASAMNSTTVDYVDHEPQRCSIAARYGARILLPEAIEPLRYDIIFVADPQRRSLEAAFRAAAPGGFITSATPTLDGAPLLDTAELYHRGVTWIIGRPDCRAAHTGVMSAWSDCGFDPTTLPVSRVDWSDAPAAWAANALYVAAVRD